MTERNLPSSTKAYKGKTWMSLFAETKLPEMGGLKI